MKIKVIAGLAVVAAIAAAGGAAAATRETGSPEPLAAPATVAQASANTVKAAAAERQAWAQRYGQDRATMPVQPDVAAATPEQQAAALDLLKRTEAATAEYADVAKAKAAGYDLQAALDRLARTKPAKFRRLTMAGATSMGRMPMVHVPNKDFARDGAVLDPAKPESLMYEPDGSGGWKLVGVMFSARAAFPDAPPTPGGPVTRWHYHTINGQPGGGLMMHIFFVPGDDLARAYATEMSA